MMKIILIFWALTHNAITEPTIIDGWKSMDECVAAAESLTEKNPEERATFKYALIAQCEWVPK